MKFLFITTCIALVLHVTDFVLAGLAIFNAYINFGNQLLSTCNRDANSFATVVANAGYSGAQLNPNYNPNCVASNPNCNINAYPLLNYNFDYWYSQMQNYILTLYNYYSYVFRYSFEVDSLHVLFTSEMMIIEIGMLVVVGHMISEIEDSERLAEETVEEPDPRLIGSQMAIPHNRSAASKSDSPPAYAAGSNEPIYVNMHVAVGNGRHSPSRNNSAWSVNSPNHHGQSLNSLSVPQGGLSNEKF